MKSASGFFFCIFSCHSLSCVCVSPYPNILKVPIRFASGCATLKTRNDVQHRDAYLWHGFTESIWQTQTHLHIRGSGIAGSCATRPASAKSILLRGPTIRAGRGNVNNLAFGTTSRSCSSISSQMRYLHRPDPPTGHYCWQCLSVAACKLYISSISNLVIFIFSYSGYSGELGRLLFQKKKKTGVPSKPPQLPSC